jgi:hypothetical protein
MLLDFVAVILATGAIIDVWHKGSIFASKRAYIQAVQDNTDPDTIKGKWLELLTCAYCESYHVPVYLFAILLAADYFSATLATVVRVFVYGWAATRASNLIDGLLPNRMRYAPIPGVGLSNDD